MIIVIQTKLKDILVSKNMTQKQLAEETDLRPNAISEMCSNNKTVINKEHLEKVMKQLDIQSFDEILEMK